MELGVRIAGDASLVVSALREVVRELDPNLPISDVEWMDRVLARTMGDQAVMAVILTLFAWVALFLTALGLYGVLAYYVSLRIPELGLRIALGADSRGVMRLVASRGLGLLALGMVLGLAGSFGVTRFLQGLLFGVQPTDPVTFFVISIFFTSSFIDEKIDRRIAVLLSAPVTPVQIIAGKMLPHMAFSLVSVAVITLLLKGNLLLAMAIFIPVILFIFAIYLMVLLGSLNLNR